MPPQDQVQGVPISIQVFADYASQKAAKKVALGRDQQDFYELKIRKFDPDNGAPAQPIKLPLDRKGIETIAKGLEQTNADLQKQIDTNLAAIKTLREVIPVEMDALDQAAKDAGDI